MTAASAGGAYTASVWPGHTLAVALICVLIVLALSMTDLKDAR